MVNLKRKIENDLEEYFTTKSNRMLLLDGARQVGKSFAVRAVGRRMFKNYVEINMEEDKLGAHLFEEATDVQSFLLALSSVAGAKLGSRADTLVFIDEIQAYPHLLTLIKFLMADNRYTYVASGSLLGVTLRKSQSIPVGSIKHLRVFPLDFEEFLWANDVGTEAIESVRQNFENRSALPEALHDRLLDLFRRYLLTGGMPAAVSTYIAEHNIVRVRNVQSDIRMLYGEDAAKYEAENGKKLKIRRIYQMIPSSHESTKKRIVIKEIEGKIGKRTNDYQNEFDYLVASGIAIEVDAVSKPCYPLFQSSAKNLLKLYMNDVGLYSDILFGNDIMPVLKDRNNVNLGSLYETVVAQELTAHSHRTFYYDNKKIGEVDFLIDDKRHSAVMPIEVKSGKDYKIHHALNRFISVPDYKTHEAIILSNARDVSIENGVTHLPIYYVMFLGTESIPESELYF